MISTQLTRLAEQNNWQTDTEEAIVYGLYNDYRFSVMDGVGFKAIFTPVAGISPDGLIALETWLSENEKQLKLRNFEFAENFLCVRLKESWRPRSTDQIEWILAQLAGMLDQFELPTEACVICGKPASKQGLLNGLYCALHPECQDLETTDFVTAGRQSGPDSTVWTADSQSVAGLDPDTDYDLADPESDSREEPDADE